jgi:FkbM family methyltransferase
MLKPIIELIKNPSFIFPLILQKIHGYQEWLYVNWDSYLLKRKSHSILFVDLGANLGQGYSWFSRYFNGPKIDFELFEPNPNCFLELQKFPFVKSGKVKVHNTGVGANSGSFSLYGLADNEGGKFSQGGSIYHGHNSIYYSAAAAIEVEIIDFSEYLKDKAENYNIIIVKMDIEGAEVELLEKMIADGSIGLIDYLYVEFHSHFQEEVNFLITKKRETKIINNLKSLKDFHLRIWH